MSHSIIVFQNDRALETVKWAGGEDSAIALAKSHFQAERTKLGATGIIVVDGVGRVVFAATDAEFS